MSVLYHQVSKFLVSLAFVHLLSLSYLNRRLKASFIYPFTVIITIIITVLAIVAITEFAKKLMSFIFILTLSLAAI